MLRFFYIFIGKARRLKQAKEEAQDEIEKYRQERERQFREFEAKVSIGFLCIMLIFIVRFNSNVIGNVTSMLSQHMGSKEDVAARIEADTRVKIEEMNQTVATHKNSVSLLHNS